MNSSTHTARKQKSLLLIDLMPPSPFPSQSPAAHAVPFFESVSCFVSFKFFHGFCLLLTHFFLLCFFFFLLLFLCDFVFCHKLRWSTSSATCRCKDAPQFQTWHSYTLCFMRYFSLPSLLPRATPIYGGFAAEITLKFCASKLQLQQKALFS